MIILWGPPGSLTSPGYWYPPTHSKPHCVSLWNSWTLQRVFAMKKNVNQMLKIEKLFFVTHVLKSLQSIWKLSTHLKCAKERCVVTSECLPSNIFNVCLKVIMSLWLENTLKTMPYCHFLTYLFFCLLENKAMPHRNYRFNILWPEKEIVVSVSLKGWLRKAGQKSNLSSP